MKKLGQSRYQPNPAYGGRKERDGFVCAKPTGTHSSGLWCVAVKIADDDVAIRDTKDVGDTTLKFTRKEWAAFVQGVKNGEFDV